MFLLSADFVLINQLFRRILSEILSECQTVWVWTRPDILSGHIWVQTACKGYQQTTLVGKELNSQSAIMTDQCQYPSRSCADPENFVRGGQTLTTFLFSWWGVGGSKYHYKRAIIGLPAKRHLNGASLACWWWPNIKFWLGRFVIFQGTLTRISKKTLYLRGPDPLSPLPLWIRTCCLTERLLMGRKESNQNNLFGHTKHLHQNGHYKFQRKPWDANNCRLLWETF